MTSRNHGRRRVDVHALLAAITVAGCGKARDDVPVPPPTPPPVDPTPTAPGWRIDLPIRIIVVDPTMYGATATELFDGALLLLGNGDKAVTSSVVARVLS